jgi:predicted amidohydrolase
MKTGRKATIVSISMKPRPIEKILPILEQEAAGESDLLLLPETCLGNETIVAPEGKEIGQVSAIAKKYGKYIVFPVYRCTEKIKRINSSILFGRAGEIIGIYDKVYPYWNEFDLDPAVVPGDDAPVFETDFGKVGLAICFDVNFPEVWKRLSMKGAELVLWSSAYSAGISLQAHAINHNFMIISSTWTPDCLVYDITGQELFYGQGEDTAIFRTEVDLDRCIFHQNFNIERRDKLLKEKAGEIEMDTEFEREQWFTLRALKPGVSARALAGEYGLEELSAYKLRSQTEIDKIRGYRFAGKVL